MVDKVTWAVIGLSFNDGFIHGIRQGIGEKSGGEQSTRKIDRSVQKVMLYNSSLQNSICQ